MTPDFSSIPDSRLIGQRRSVRAGLLARLLDRYAGVFILRVIGIVRRRQGTPASPQRIGLLVINAIGDAILVSATATDLRRAFPSAHLTLVLTGANRPVEKLVACVDECLVLPLFKPLNSISILRKSRFDVLIDFSQWTRVTAIYAALSGAYTIGFRTEGQARHFAYDGTGHHLGSRHELENFRSLLQPLGIRATSRPTLALSAGACAAARALVPEERYVIFHPWAGGANAWRREWPTGNWVRLAFLVRAEGFSVIVTGGPAEREPTERLIEMASRFSVEIRPVAGNLSLEETGALISTSTAVVSVNTGLMHLAASLDVPMVALHGPTNPLRWGPLSDHAIVVAPLEGPSAFLNLGFEYPKNVIDCMGSISVDSVWQPLASFLRSSSTNARARV